MHVPILLSARWVAKFRDFFLFGLEGNTNAFRIRSPSTKKWQNIENHKVLRRKFDQLELFWYEIIRQFFYIYCV